MWGLLTGQLGGVGARLVVATAFAFLAWLSLHEVTSWDAARFEAVRVEADKRVATAIAERDAHWTSQIEQGNRLVAERHAADLATAMRDAGALRQTNGELFAALAEMEKRNAQKPGGKADCLDAGDLDELRRLWKRAK